MIAISRSAIVLALFPDSNLHTIKRRPALIIQRDGLDSVLAQIMVAMISGNSLRAVHPSRVLIRLSDAENCITGLDLDSVVVTDNLATIVHHEIDRVIGRIPAMRLVDAALRRQDLLPALP